MATAAASNLLKSMPSHTAATPSHTTIPPLSTNSSPSKPHAGAHPVKSGYLEGSEAPGNTIGEHMVVAPGSQASTADTQSSEHMTLIDDKDSSQSSVEHIAESPDPQKNIYDPAPAILAQNGTSRWRQDASTQLHINTIAPESGEKRNGFQPIGQKQGQKRTASGMIKNSSSTSLSPLDPIHPSPARSAASPTQVNELSTQLRTRLSYAMLKVQNGWETRNFGDLEHMTPALGFSLSPLRSDASPQYNGTLTSAHKPIDASLGPRQRLAFPENLEPSPAIRSGPKLEPAVNLEPVRDIRRSIGPARIPTLANGDSSRSWSSQSPVHSRSPSGISYDSLYRSPRDVASASERDAIETLMFMSSPGNTQNFKKADGPLLQYIRPQPTGTFGDRRLVYPTGPTPGRKQVSFLPAKSTELLPRMNGQPLSPRRKDLLDNAALGTDEGIDKFLDQMPTAGADGYSSSEESTGSVAVPQERTGPTRS